MGRNSFPAMISSSYNKTPALSKRLNASKGMDRITSLPESLIVHILSFLRIRDQIRTGVLSRSWQYIWTCVPNLDFCYGLDGPDSQTEFVNFVDKTLIVRNGARVESFSVSRFEYKGDYASSVNLWTRLAARNGTHKFKLDFAHWEEHYRLPQFLFTNTSVRELRFEGCVVDPTVLVTWNSLKKLSLYKITIGSEDAIQRILAGTPVLEILELIYVEGFKSLHLGTASSVKELAVSYQGSELELSGPNLLSLKISGYFSGYIKLADLPSLVKVSLQWVRIDWNSIDCLDIARHLLNDLLHVETLTLGEVGIELCPKAGLSKWKNLTIHVRPWKTHPWAIATLLESCPELETLIINMSSNWGDMGCYEEYRKGQFWKSQKSVFNGLKFLRTVEFVEFWKHRDTTFSIAEFLLEKASTLQKLIVDMKTKCRNCTTLNVHETTQWLSSRPRSSPDAKIVVY